MKLYFSPGACSMSPHIVLREAGCEFELERVDLAAKKTAGGEDYLAVNPKGYVPALRLDDGEILTEGPAIVQYVADGKPESGLAPAAGTFERNRLQEWLNFISTELHKPFSPLFSPDTPDAARAAATELLGKRLGIVDAALKDRDFLMGDRFTVADAYCFTVVNWANFVKLDIGSWPAIGAYMESVGARPAVRAAMEAEGLLG